MVEFENCKLVGQLEPQSPMIHFQHNQTGVTLRASEVKPKLDRFILEQLSKEKSKEELEGEGIFISSDHEALDYKMKIVDEKKDDLNDDDLKIDDYKMFYGNSGRKEKIDCIKSTARLEIFCFNEKLQEYIKTYLEDFFIVYNFGTMQNKGFGGFIFVPLKQPNDKKKLSNEEINQIAKTIKKYTGSANCYTMTFSNANDWQRMFDEIKTFYGVMKSGQNFNGYARSYLFQYLHDEGKNTAEKNIGNEKAWMKQKGIAPILSKDENVKKQDLQDSDSRYVRAMLGVGSSIQFATKYFDDPKTGKKKLDSKSKATINIENKDNRDKIERASSPIYFKVIKNVVFIFAYDIDEDLFDRTFEFSSEKVKGTINTLGEKEFDVHHFLESYVSYYNLELPKLISNVKQKVKKAGV